MKIEVLLGFKNADEQKATFEVEMPEKEGKDKDKDKKALEPAFAKIVRMIMHKDMQRGFINTGSFGFRIEDVSYVKLLQ